MLIMKTFYTPKFFFGKTMLQNSLNEIRPKGLPLGSYLEKKKFLGFGKDILRLLSSLELMLVGL